MIDTADSNQKPSATIKISRRGWYTLVLILVVAAYLRVSSSNSTPSSFSWWLFFPVSIFAIGLLWLTVYRYLNYTAALVTGLMFAVSPWAIILSTDFDSWYMTISVVVITLLLYGSISQKRRVAIISGILLLLTVYVIAYRHSPFLKVNFQSIPDSANALIQVTAGYGIEEIVRNQTTRQAVVVDLTDPSAVWILLLGCAALIGLPALWLRAPLIAILALIMIFIPLIAPVRIPSLDYPAVYPVDFNLAFPALCLLVGAGVAWLIKLLPGKPYSRMIVLAAYGAIFLSQGLWWMGVVRYLQSNP